MSMYGVYDGQIMIPKEMQKRLDEIAIVCGLVFEGDIKKTTMWFHTQNPSLGNTSPRDMIRFGQFYKLYQFVISALNGDAP